MQEVFKPSKGNATEVPSAFQNPLKPFAEESGFSDTLEGHLKDRFSVLELFKAAQNYPHESALKKQCSWTKQYLQMKLSNWNKISVQDKYLKQEIDFKLKMLLVFSLMQALRRQLIAININ